MTDPRTSPARVLGVDLARGLALLGMFIAHTAPAEGPGGVLMVSEYFPFPLFVLLLGAGAEFVGRRTTPARHAAESLARAACLLLIGWGLTFAGAQVYVVLGAMAVAVAVAWVFAVSSAPVLWGAVIVGFLADGHWNSWFAPARTDLLLAGRTDAVRWFDLVLSPAYPVPFVLACTALGVLVARRLHPQHSDAPSPRVLVGAGVVLLGLGGVVLLLHRWSLVSAGSDSFGWATTVASLVMALGAWTLAEWAAALAPRAVRPLQAVGAMSLTLYTLHVVWLGYWVTVLRPGERDDTWVNVVGMSVVAFVVAGAWRLLNLPGRWWRGPLEGAVGAVARACGVLVARQGRRHASA